MSANLQNNRKTQGFGSRLLVVRVSRLSTRYAVCSGQYSLVTLDSGDLIFVVYENDNWIQRVNIAGFDPRLGENNDFVAGLEEARRCAIDADIALAALARQDIGSPECGMKPFQYVNITNASNAASRRSWSIVIEPEIVQFGLRNRCATEKLDSRMGGPCSNELPMLPGEPNDSVLRGGARHRLPLLRRHVG